MSGIKLRVSNRIGSKLGKRGEERIGDDLRLVDGSRVAVMGGGPAGSLFSYFLLGMADVFGTKIHLDLYESKDFTRPGPAGCNYCGGIISESLVQILATEGINLPPGVVQRGIDSHTLHMDVGSIRIKTPVNEKRIAAVHRGAGPKGLRQTKWNSFDGYLQELAVKRQARLIRERIQEVRLVDGRPRIRTRSGEPMTYDLLAVATGVNASALRHFEDLGIGYTAPISTKTYICEFLLGQETIEKALGSSMHVFLLDIPRLEFGALIPKGDYVTMCLLGTAIDTPMINTFLDSPQVRQCFPGGEIPMKNCWCSPSLVVNGARTTFADRLVFIGDCGVTRLYKDGLGAAFRTSKAAAATAIFSGISADDFRRHFRPACWAITFDNAIGKIVYTVTSLIRKVRLLRHGILRMLINEQSSAGSRRMSTVLWDTFTGSTPYREVFARSVHPGFISSLIFNTLAGIRSIPLRLKEDKMSGGDLGKNYSDGELIIRQGEVGNSMYVVLSGKVEVFKIENGLELFLGMMGEGDFFGEMALVDREVRSASVRAIGDVRVLTVDKKTFLSRVHADPSLALRIVQKLSGRIRGLHTELARAKQKPQS